MHCLGYVRRLLRQLRQARQGALPPALIDRTAWWLAWLSHQSGPWWWLRQRLVRQLWWHTAPFSRLLDFSPPLRGTLYQIRFRRTPGGKGWTIEII